MQLIIAEKPSVGRAIAECIPGNRTRSDGFITVGDITVTWCFGHLLELAPPEHYNAAWKSWNIEHLPYAVRDFALLPKTDAKKQLKIIKDLLKKASEVVNCGDPDREGQMLVDEVLEHFKWRGKTTRMHLNSTDEASIKAALKDLQDNAKFRNLYESAKCRSRADWLVGMSLTAAATKSLTQYPDMITIGRVQTPTLALVVRRDLEIENFKKQNFFSLKASINTPQGIVELKHEPADDARILDKSVADALAKAITGVTVDLKVTSAKKKETPPKPFSLLTFSSAAGKAFGWTAKQCLEVAQKLYEPEYGLTTYPRTASTDLKDEHRAQVPSILEAIYKGGHVQHNHLAASPVLRDSVFDSKKVVEHHAIIPTSKAPSASLTGDLLAGYKLIAERFVQSISPDYEYQETILEFTHEGRVYKLRGTTPLNTNQSWRAFAPKTGVTVPALSDGAYSVAQCEVLTGTTTPPDRYSETSLQDDMVGVGKFVTDPKIKARLKESSGIGTPATRANIIESLKKRGYIKTEKKTIVSTDFGRQIIAAIPDVLKDPGMTALWEDALDQIAAGTYRPADYMEKIDNFVKNRVEEFKKLNGQGVKVSSGKAKND